MKMKLKSLSAFLTVIILTTAAACSQNTAEYSGGTYEHLSGAVKLSESSETDEFTLVAENDKLQLLMDKANVTFAILHKETGCIWYTNPIDRWNDAGAKAKVKQEMSSSFIVNYITERLMSDSAASFTYCVKDGNYKIVPVKAGVRVEFTFPKEGFVIPLELTLKGDSLSCRIPVSEIKETGENRLSGIDLFPYFDAGGSGDEGYVLLPDGCGALLDFNNGKYMYNQYSEKVYGRDPNFDLNRSNEVKQSVHLPVFGIKNNGKGLLAVITDGSAAAYVKANAAGKDSSYTNVYFSFELLSSDTYILGETVGSRVKLTQIIQEGYTDYKNIEVRYFFLTNGNDYDDMALRYKQYLVEEGGVSKRQVSSVPLFVETLGAIEKKEPILGIPFTVTKALTDYAEAVSMLEAFQKAGVSDLALIYNKWDKASVEERPPSRLSLISKMGGAKAFDRLQEFCRENHIGFFPNIELQKVRKWGNGYSAIFHAAKTISGNHVRVYSYDMATRFKEKTDFYWLLSPLFFEKLRGSLSVQLGRLNIDAAAMGSAGNMLYSDFRSDTHTRQDSLNELVGLVNTLRNSLGAVMIRGGDDYLLPYADCVVDVPSDASAFDATDRSVPFMQIVLSGLWNYAYTPVNLSPDPDEAVLTVAETGAMLHCYILDSSAIGELRTTSYTYLYSADKALWIPRAAQMYERLSPLMQKVKGKGIVNHETKQKGVTLTEYENGVCVIVNKTDTPVKIDGIDIPAKDFVVYQR